MHICVEKYQPRDTRRPILYYVMRFVQRARAKINVAPSSIFHGHASVFECAYT